MAHILDLHLHSEASDDSRAPVEAYLKWLVRKREERPLEGIVLTEHRQFNKAGDYRDLEDKYGLLILKASEVETEYGHVLVYGSDAPFSVLTDQRPEAGEGGQGWPADETDRFGLLARRLWGRLLESETRVQL